MLFIETNRLAIRDFEPTDFDDVHEYSSDYENVRHMMFGPNTPEQTRAYLEKQCAEERDAQPRMHYNFALERKEDGKVLGGISLHLNWRRDDGILGVILNRHYAGHGYVTEGLTGVLDHVFGELKLHRVHAVCDVDNAGIIHVFEKIGFRNEGRMVKRGKNRPEDPIPYFDQFGYAILAEEWEKKNKGESPADKKSF